MTVLLRPRRPGDTAALVEVFVAAFRHGYPDVLPADVLATVAPATVTGWFARWSPDLSTTIAERDGVPVGFVRYGEDSDSDGAGGAGADDGPGGSADAVPAAAGSGCAAGPAAAGSGCAAGPAGAGCGSAAGPAAAGSGSPATRPGYVAALYVHPDAGGLGIGRRLLEHAVTALRAQGKDAVTLWVFRENARARGLYASAGFVPDGTEAVDPQWRVPQIRLRKDLAAP